MRIDLVQAGFGAGGAEKIVRLLATHWCGGGHDVRVLAIAQREPGTYYEYPAGVRLSGLRVDAAAPDRGRLATLRAPRSVARSWRRVREVRWLRARWREDRPDVVVSFLTKVNVASALAAGSIPLVLSERNNPLLQSGALWRGAAHLAARRANALVMQTAAARDTLEPAARERAWVVPNPLVLPPGCPREMPDRADFVAVGRLDRQKGFDLLIEAFARHARCGGGGSLTIHGEGPERGRLEALARDPAIAGRVRLPGVTPTPGAWLAEGGIFVLSSRFEGYPNVLVEALGAGLPTIAFDCPWGPRELLGGDRGDTPMEPPRGGHHGMLVPNGDVDALAGAMSRLAGDPERRRALARGGSRAVAHLSREAVLARWDATLRSAVESGTADRDAARSGRKYTTPIP